MNKTLEITMNVDEAPREIIFRKPHSRGYDEYVYILKECARIVGRKRGAAGTMCLPPSPDRWKIRSRTFEGIAEAMAEQWSDNIDSE